MMTLNDEQLKLKEWLEVYTLHCQLTVTSVPESSAKVIDFSGEPVPANGQIRLWPAIELNDPPMYGVIMNAGYCRWRAFPFSELPLPASPQELQLRERGPVQVLQGWNCRELTQAQVSKSWWVDTLSEEKIFQLQLWWTGLQCGEEPVGHLKGLCGPALRHPLDPRHAYMASEARRADHCLGEAQLGYGQGAELPLAAEPESEYGTKKSENDDTE
ncbi:hypothetical protein P3T73_16610 [Kiritimatiellota bacterium B12222]|nr:hypothetical protein P3T73_16610 [Kiritimatiellota bacterium B12222]